jgi:hypothetical protein
MPQAALSRLYQRDGLRDLVLPRKMNVKRLAERQLKSRSIIERVRMNGAQARRQFRYARPHESETEDTCLRGARASDRFEIVSLEGHVADHVRRGHPPFPCPVQDVLAAVIRMRMSGDPGLRQEIAEHGAARPGGCGYDVRGDGHELLPLQAQTETLPEFWLTFGTRRSRQAGVSKRADGSFGNEARLWAFSWETAATRSLFLVSREDCFWRVVRAYRARSSDRRGRRATGQKSQLQTQTLPAVRPIGGVARRHPLEVNISKSLAAALVQ